jgi:apolipoprotein D and lipocalin family protein
MMNWIVFIVIVAAIIVASQNLWVTKKLGDLVHRRKAVASIAYDSSERPFDINRYLGRWYQAFRLPNRFQNDDAYLTYADYTPSPAKNGTIIVKNKQILGPSSIPITSGVAWRPDPSKHPASLRVSFFRPFSGEYTVIAVVDGDDGSYSEALVGSSSRKNLWLLTRNPNAQPSQEIMDMMIDGASRLGFDVSKLIFTPKKEMWWEKK